MWMTTQLWVKLQSLFRANYVMAQGTYYQHLDFAHWLIIGSLNDKFLMFCWFTVKILLQDRQSLDNSVSQKFHENKVGRLRDIQVGHKNLRKFSNNN